MRDRSPLWRVLALLMTLTLVGAACDDSDDDGEDATPTEDTTEPTAAAPVPVTATDYAYGGLPAEVAPGTTFTLQNDSEDEVHEIVALRVQDGEERTAEELLALPEEESMTVAEVRGVTVAFPGESGTIPAPNVTVEQPGRYLFICAIPVGADPQEYREAAAAQTEPGPVEVDGGAPHFTEGMWAEVTVG